MSLFVFPTQDVTDCQIEGFRKIPVSNGQFYVVMIIRVFDKASVAKESAYHKAKIARTIETQLSLLELIQPPSE